MLVWIGDTTGDVPFEEFAVRAFEKWKVGRKGIDDGVVLFFFAKDRKVRIEVGYGLEDKIPDVVASRIIRETIVPHLRAGDPDGRGYGGRRGGRWPDSTASCRNRKRARCNSLARFARSGHLSGHRLVGPHRVSRYPPDARRVPLHELLVRWPGVEAASGGEWVRRRRGFGGGGGRSGGGGASGSW